MRITEAPALVHPGAVSAARATLVERIWYSLPTLPLVREANVKSKSSPKYQYSLVVL
jgi:hypothetical protein